MKRLFILILVLLPLVFTGCDGDIVEQTEYTLTIEYASANVDVGNNIVDILLTIRNDGVHDYDAIDFWVKFTAGSTSESLSYSWVGAGDFFEVGDSIDIPITASGGEFATILLSELTSIRLVEADLWNYNESNDKLFTYQFEGDKANIWTD